MGNLVIKPSNKVNIIYPEVVDVYFAKKVEENGKDVLKRINEAYFGEKVYIVNDLNNLFRYKIKIQIFRFVKNFPFGETELFMIQQDGVETDTIVLENELSTEIILAPKDKSKYQLYENRLRSKPIEFYIKVVAENKEKNGVVCYNLKEHKYDYENPPNFWYHKEGNRFTLKVKEENIIYVTRKWEKWTGVNKNSATYGTFVFDNITGFICEPHGPETKQSGKDKRIPVGTYDLVWHPKSGRFPKNVYTKSGRYATKPKNPFKIDFPELKNGIILLFNENVPKSRGILLHAGYNGEWTEGCILPFKNLNMKARDKNTELKESIELLLEIYEKIDRIGIEKVKIVIKDEIEINKEDEEYGKIIKKRNK